MGRLWWRPLEDGLAKLFSPTVDDFSVDFSCRIHPPSLFTRRRLTAAYSYKKHWLCLFLVAMVRPSVIRGSVNIAEERVPGSDPMIL